MTSLASADCFDCLRPASVRRERRVSLRRSLCGGGRERRLDVGQEEEGGRLVECDQRGFEVQDGGRPNRLMRGAKSMGKRQEAKKAFMKAMTPIRRVEG